jgi:hypothetical protein
VPAVKFYLSPSMPSSANRWRSWSLGGQGGPPTGKAADRHSEQDRQALPSAASAMALSSQHQGRADNACPVSVERAHSPFR